MCTHHSRAPRPLHSRRRILSGLAAATALSALPLRPALAAASPIDLPPPGPRDTCPVCGMFVSKYPEWVATVLYDDGNAVHFDGAKDFFKYLADMPKYAPDRAVEQITGMGVTEYYGLKMVEARSAQYVIGSDTYGPMGHELIPLMTDLDAADFMKDHAGKRLLGFDDVTPEILTGLDQGTFE